MADCSWRDVGLRRFFAVALGFAYLQIHSDKRSPSTFDVHMPPVSTGLLIGEGLADVLGAPLAAADIGGSAYGTAVGFPGPGWNT